MPLAPAFAQLANDLFARGMPNAAGLSIPRARAELLRMRDLQDPPAELHKVRDLLVPTTAGAIPIRVYVPHTAQGPAPAMLYFHGGGWVLGGVEVADTSCRDLADRAGCVVVSVEYRLAPETKFPGPLEDCYAATAWVVEHAADLGVNPAAVAVSGDSAGGNLAAGLALLARDRGAPAIAFQALIYPVVAAGQSAIRCDPDAPDSGRVPSRGSEQADWYRDRYLRTGADLRNPYAVPLAAAGHADLPPAYIASCEFDRLLPENIEYAERLRQAGVHVTHTVFAEEIHGFFWMGARVRPNYSVLLAEISAAFHSAIDR